MIITVDSNILLSVFARDSLFETSSELLVAYSTSEYIIDRCIYLELAVHFQEFDKLDTALEALEVRLLEAHHVDTAQALNAWSSYLKQKKFTYAFCRKETSAVCAQCGRVLSFRQRVLTDFLIGGFALAAGDAVMTLDPVYYQNYFPDLQIITG